MLDEVLDDSSLEITFIIEDADEPPYFRIEPLAGIKQEGLSYRVPEAFTEPFLKLTPIDPEGVEDIDTWTWDIIEDSDSSYFSLDPLESKTISKTNKDDPAANSFLILTLSQILKILKIMI